MLHQSSVPGAGTFGQVHFGNPTAGPQSNNHALPPHLQQQQQLHQQHLHQQQQHPFPPQYHGGSNHLPTDPSVMMQPGQRQPALQASTTAPPPVSAAAAAAAAPALAPQQHQQGSNSSSPQPGHLANASPLGPQTPTSYPMAAPGLPPTQQQAHAPQQQSLSTSAVASPRSPQSPGGPPGQKQERISLLLDINSQLLQRLSELQAAGHGGATTPQQALQLKMEGKPDKMASDEFLQIIKRLQFNLSYLQPNKTPEQQAKAMAGAAFLTPPPQMPQLQGSYDRLRDLFPERQAMEKMRQNSLSSPRGGFPPNSLNGGAPMPQGPQ